jgi:hypothetical protein
VVAYIDIRIFSPSAMGTDIEIYTSINDIYGISVGKVVLRLKASGPRCLLRHGKASLQPDLHEQPPVTLLREIGGEMRKY